MALITGSGGDYNENYSRRGNASRFNQQEAQNFASDAIAQVMAALGAAGQGIAGLFQGGAPNTTANNILITGDTPNDPRITGTTEDTRITQSGGRGGGQSSIPAMGARGGETGDVRRPITGAQVELADQTRRGGGQSSIPAMGARGSGGNNPPNPPSGGGGGGGGNSPNDPSNPNARGGALNSLGNLFGGELNREAVTRNLGRLGYLAPALGAFQDYTEGQSAQAVAAGAASGLGATYLTRAAGRALGGGKGAALQLAAPLLGIGAQELVGKTVQKQRQRETGEGDPNALSTQLGRIEQLQKVGLEGNVALMNAANSGAKDMLAHALEQERTHMQAMFPMLEQQRNNDVVRQQQIMNSMGANFAMLGSMATTGKLALGAQANAGANLRQMMTAAPYANAVLQAPNISF
jgi:hypothetical protein